MEIWNEVKKYIKSRKHISTLKGGAEAEIIDVSDTKISLKLKKGNIAELNKSHFEKAINILDEKGMIRQKDIPGTPQRYVLGVLSKLPGYCVSFDKSEGVYYVVKENLSDTM